MTYQERAVRDIILKHLGDDPSMIHDFNLLATAIVRELSNEGMIAPEWPWA